MVKLVGLYTLRLGDDHQSMLIGFFIIYIPMKYPLCFQDSRYDEKETLIPRFDPGTCGGFLK